MTIIRHLITDWQVNRIYVAITSFSSGRGYKFFSLLLTTETQQKCFIAYTPFLHDHLQSHVELFNNILT